MIQSVSVSCDLSLVLFRDELIILKWGSDRITLPYLDLDKEYDSVALFGSYQTGTIENI